MNKYKFLYGWNEEEYFVCLAEDIFSAFRYFEYFCVSNNLNVKSVTIEEVESAWL